MTGDLEPDGVRFLSYLATRARHPRGWTGDGHFLARLSPADYVSLLALLTAWSAS